MCCFRHNIYAFPTASHNIQLSSVNHICPRHHQLQHPAVSCQVLLTGSPPYTTYPSNFVTKMVVLRELEFGGRLQNVKNKNVPFIWMRSLYGANWQITKYVQFYRTSDGEKLFSGFRGKVVRPWARLFGANMQMAMLFYVWISLRQCNILYTHPQFVAICGRGGRLQMTRLEICHIFEVYISNILNWYAESLLNVMPVVQVTVPIFPLLIGSMLCDRRHLSTFKP